ncbi:MAG: hypothetical protein LBU27_05900 [Candidatus Peribacteria bacterium]|jgi:hypothetical protein|nr:hypothetical protein [Candidatus Peribacteria bacterium]
MYSIKSPDYLEKIVALVDDTPVFTKTILGNSKEELSTTILNLSGTAPGKHNFTVQAITSAGTINRSTVSITIQDTDKQPPYFAQEQSKTTETAAGREVKLVFNDYLSALVGGTISANGEKILDFSNRVANFTTTATTVEVVVKDAYDNTLKQTIDLTSL